MNRTTALLTLITAILIFSCDDPGGGGRPDHWDEGLEPGVNWGLAKDYPLDEGIADHPDVLGAEDFEAGEVKIPTEEDRYVNNTEVVSDTVYTGSYAGRHAWEEGYNGPTCRFVVPPEVNEERQSYFVRMCFDFDDSFHPLDQDRGVGVKGFGVVAEREGVDTGLNTPCDGTNWYNAQVQFVGWGNSSKPEANDGYLWVGHQYSYNPYPEQATAEVGTLEVSDPAQGDRPYRFSSYADPFFYIDFGGWHCYEVGLYLNTPGRNDGEARFWIDGVLQSRVIDMRYRDAADLFPTHMHLNLHRTTADFEHTMVRWTDNIVLATRYIGPVATE